jgi:hypothetical protein
MRLFCCIASGWLCGWWVVLAILPHVQPAGHMRAQEVRQRLALLNAFGTARVVKARHDGLVLLQQFCLLC